MADKDAFTQARGCFEEMLDWLEGRESAQLFHGDLEDEIVHRGREAQRLAFQDRLDLRALRERRVADVDADGVVHGAVEGAVRHVVRDRKDVTGARWSVEGAEAVLKLTIPANPDTESGVFGHVGWLVAW